MGINLVYTTPQISLISNVDTNRIKEVIINLIGNSLKFTPKDNSIIVTVSKNKEGFAFDRSERYRAGNQQHGYDKIVYKIQHDRHQ